MVVRHYFWSVNKNGTVDIAFKWSFQEGTNDSDFINGFIIRWKKHDDTTWKIEYAEPDDRYYILVGVPLVGSSSSYDIEVESYRIVDSSIDPSGVKYSGMDSTLPAQWLNYNINHDVQFEGTITPNSIISGTEASTVVGNANNGKRVYDETINTIRNGNVIPAPTLPLGGTCIDHVKNDDGSVDISFEWQYTEYSNSPINGFGIVVHASNDSNPQILIVRRINLVILIYYVDKKQDHLCLMGIPTKYYTFEYLLQKC